MANRRLTKQATSLKDSDTHSVTSNEEFDLGGTYSKTKLITKTWVCTYAHTPPCVASVIKIHMDRRGSLPKMSKRGTAGRTCF